MPDANAQQPAPPPQPAKTLAPDFAARLAHDYAWNWFAYHAQQRMTLFNFSLITLAALGTGYATAFSQSWYITSSICAALAWFASTLYYRLDKRNSRLTKLAENYLQCGTELILAPHVGSSIMLTAQADAAAAKGRFVSFGQLIRLFHAVYRTVAICALAVASVYAVTRGAWW